MIQTLPRILRFEDLDFQATQRGPAARVHFPNKYIALVQPEAEQPGTYLVETLNEFEIPLRVRRGLAADEVSHELDRIRSDPSADE